MGDRRLVGGSCFSGIGGFERGAEVAGVDVDWEWQIELSSYRRSVLARQCPARVQYDDIRSPHVTQTIGMLRHPDVIVGGFPCKDVSDASRGRQKGMLGEQSGLWSEMLDIIGLLSPAYVVVENVDGAAWKRYLPVVRRDLHRVGYSSLPIRVRANQLGAPYRGSRIFTVASANGKGKPARAEHVQMAELQKPTATCWAASRETAPWHLGVADGVPRGVERVEALGDSISPPCAAFVWSVLRAAIDDDTAAPAQPEEGGRDA